MTKERHFYSIKELYYVKPKTQCKTETTCLLMQAFQKSPRYYCFENIHREGAGGWKAPKDPVP